VDEEHVIDSGFDFNSPEEQLWEVEEHVASQHSVSVHVDEEHVIVPDFNSPEEQLWDVEEHVAGAAVGQVTSESSSKVPKAPHVYLVVKAASPKP
jgi:hypothetical protein